MPSTMSEWRAATDPDDLREYDRFGPWIDNVTQAVDMPRRFRPWWPELSGAQYLLKVPRSYDRAQIRPGMDLYESVIAVLPEKLCVLRAEPAGVVRLDVARHEVVASVRYSNLLIGRWSLLLADGGSVDVAFNSVSLPMVSEVDRVVMSGGEGLSGEVSQWTPSAAPGHQPRDHFFRSTVATLSAEGGGRVRPLHIEEPDQPCRTEKNRVRRSAGMMILHSPDDLLVFNRTMAARPLFRRANYAVNTIRIPFRLMTSFEIRRPEQTSPPGFSHLVITCDRQVITQAVLQPPEDVADLLSARGVPGKTSAGIDVVGRERGPDARDV